MRSTCDLAEGTNPNLPQVNNLFSFLFHRTNESMSFEKSFRLLTRIFRISLPSPPPFLEPSRKKAFATERQLNRRQ